LSLLSIYFKLCCCDFDYVGRSGTNGKDGRDGIEGNDGKNGKDGQTGLTGKKKYEEINSNFKKTNFDEF
jgi:hypothetical protein